MRISLTFITSALLFLTAPSAFANADLAAKKSCLACHTIQYKVVGPAFKDVATKYRGVEGAQEKLVAKVLAGGSGTWGTTPMPPNNQVSAAEASALVTWILEQR